MADTSSTVRVSIDIDLEPIMAFEILSDELRVALDSRGLSFPASAQGRVSQGEVQVGRVLSWEPGQLIRLEWHPAEWEPGERTEVELRFESVDGRTRVTMEHRGWGRLLSGPAELLGWFADQVAWPVVLATAPSAFGDWLTDRMARRPSGSQARATYRDPLYHYPNFRVILAELGLQKDDYLLEVGCGGGALLKEALKSGCRAAAVDHSPGMVRVARETNRDAISTGRLQITESTADRLPFPDGTFSCAAMTGVLGFLPDPVAAFSEIRRVLRPGGRFVCLGSDPELKGTPGAPEPIASRLRFYEDRELEALARGAGFEEVETVRRDLYPFAKEAGIPAEHLPLFEGFSRFLLSRKG